jgi:uncharacterized membrane protein YgcG
MKTYHYSDKFKTNGETLGPVTIEELEQLYLQNKITEECMVLQNDADEWCRYLQVLAEIQEAKKEKLRGYCFFFGSSAILSIFVGLEKGNLKDGLVLFSLCIIIIMIFKIMLSSGSGGGKHGVSASGGCGGGGSIGCGGGGGCGGCGGGG